MLDRKTNRAIRQLLIPHVGDAPARRALVETAFYDSPILSQIRFDNQNAAEFAAHLVRVCDNFGEIDPGEPALVCLLDELRLHVGANVQTQIDAVKARLSQPKTSNRTNNSTPASAPNALDADELTRLTLQVIPPPFKWMAIPGGWVTLEDNIGTHRVEPFLMAKYPITNAQFEQFVVAGGYSDPQWWSGGLWEIREEKGWTEPRFWGDSKRNGAYHPVVGVSWYEAIAFTHWLSHTVGTAFLPSAGIDITLPTEMQWQRAAQGDDGREYPYGNRFDSSKSNTEKSGFGRTTPVTQYEAVGDSPFGVTDMSGNVSEVCLNKYKQPYITLIDTSGDHRVARGGAFLSLDPRYHSRAAFRIQIYSCFSRDYYRGFRVCCGFPASS